jgi:coproporphyrinogen III oxidase-like Fe-S oxidoreductase
MALHDVERAIALQPQHLSHYQLTLEPNTVFAREAAAGIPAEDDAWDMQERCIEAMAAAGYAQYEVSAYAQPAGSARTTSTTGASATTSASAPARTASSARARAARSGGAGS